METNKTYIITEEDINKLRESIEDSESYWYIDIKIDDWIETLTKITENERI